MQSAAAFTDPTDKIRQGGTDLAGTPSVLLARTSIALALGRAVRAPLERHLSSLVADPNADPAFHTRSSTAQPGATVRERQSRLGHRTPNMALYYQGATAERDRSIADRLQEQGEAAQAADST